MLFVDHGGMCLTTSLITSKERRRVFRYGLYSTNFGGWNVNRSKTPLTYQVRSKRKYVGLIALQLPQRKAAPLPRTVSSLATSTKRNARTKLRRLPWVGLLLAGRVG